MKEWLIDLLAAVFPILQGWVAMMAVQGIQKLNERIKDLPVQVTQLIVVVGNFLILQAASFLGVPVPEGEWMNLPAEAWSTLIGSAFSYYMHDSKRTKQILKESEGA